MKTAAPGPSFETASWARRIAALAVDWFASTLVVIAFIGLEDYTATGSPAPAYVLLVYVVESALLTWAVGGSFGKIATRLRVVRVDLSTRPLNPLVLLARQVAIALVIPPLVYRPDGRGLHDMLAGTATVTLDVYRTLGRTSGPTSGTSDR
ncbi:RDD family protein [Nocardioides marmotae]|uniref:RDD family protein n=1 Tax=Nocardioides marmotae TaxID=2663857 RepID=A0A6I3JEP1_9ACTN|nr:RDD family protein [Nocardioides marmotae]MCR6032899.1 RDD family protein [Gordonia jinghuaiqii]MBC9733428.1 RDD family protein [Nocardioides marmotae]MTB84535.1 RDD family protein [Nocardioides marmotae]MTB96549.1 RDD family protein [Nocardioides marmotae]QKE01931.1 RDD family protein [Nocardioides marmotae]